MRYAQMMRRPAFEIRDPRARAAIRSLRRGLVAIDCGANVGNVTAALAARRAEVYAFEPNPDAYRVLLERFASNPHVHCAPMAVSTNDGTADLYLHQDARSDPVLWSTGSSLYGDKGNVDRNTPIVVETIDLSRFVAELERPVQLLKLDVEGSEIDVLERLVDSGQLAAIRHVLVEMHDNKIPSLAAAGAQLRAMLAREEFQHVVLDWV